MHDRRDVPWSIVTALIVGFTVTCGPELTDGRIFCQEASQQLADCCPGYTCQLCVKHPDMNPNGGCGPDTSAPEPEPEVSRATLDCIQRKSCHQLRDDGTCQRAIQANRPMQTKPVCE